MVLSYGGTPIKFEIWVRKQKPEKNSAKIFMKQELIDKLPPDVK